MEKYNLPQPEAVFDIGYFKNKPEPFYKLANEFLSAKVKPVNAHYFISFLNNKKQLLLNFTQNIDGLELDAKLEQDKLIQAHGHMRTAHCINCKKSHKIEEFRKCVENETILKCSCEGLVKPDIVFFGENLPMEFFDSIKKLEKCDIAIVMGTSLAVHPFASLISMFKKQPLVLINRENPGIKRDNFAFIEGDLESSILKIVEDCGWLNEFNKFKDDNKPKI